MKEQPLVSVIIPVYNVERYLAQCLDSVSHQTYQNLEIICVNDGSRDASPEILGQYMHSMTIIRNLCAHGSRIYNRLFEQKPSLNKKEQALLIRREDGTMDNSHFFGFFVIMRRLLPTENFAEMKEAVIALTEKYPFVRMDYYGFRDDWKEKL
jgi:cellulose synthase/poly-beta-1,6-N-acetylglucosamine synthase-like glycosyltransferase